MKNLKYNRIEKGGRHKYIKEYRGGRKPKDHKYNGYIKCKLVHGNGFSIVYPDQLYLTLGEELFWIQPLYFNGNNIGFFGEDGACEQLIDISTGVCLRVVFSNETFVTHLKDYSVFYECEIEGPKQLYKYTTGKAKIENGIPFIELFHHTNKKAKAGIKTSGLYWSSSWNIQGTAEILNYSFLYLTSIPKISNIDDLTEIAMSAHGKIFLRLDNNYSEKPDLAIDVYRENTSQRTETLRHWVNATYLTPQLCYRHDDSDRVPYYEVFNPYIARIPVEPNTNIMIQGDELVPEKHKLIDSVIIGNTLTLKGLEAPYNETDVTNQFKIEKLESGMDIISFWRLNANSDQFSGKSAEIMKVEKH